MTERQLQDAVIQIATLCGWRHYHTFDSRRSAAGFPDLVLVRPPRLIFAELKTQNGVLSEPQKAWLADLGCSYAEVCVWRPDDLDEIARTLARGGGDSHGR